MDNTNLPGSSSGLGFDFKIPKKEKEVVQNPSEIPEGSNEYSNQICENYMSPLAFQQGDNFAHYYQPQQEYGLQMSVYDMLLPSNSRNLPFNPLKRAWEQPKNTNGNSTFPHRSDLTLPKELLELFQPLYCKLCTAKLNSNSMAKLHYKSKNHEKEVRKFLTEYSERTGEPLHPRAQVTVSKKQKREEDNDPKYFHCNVCDLPLTGKLHAESHYMGKNHHRALAGKAPAGKGQYTDGKWVRRCDICDLQVTSPQQMELHMNGAKHKKRLQQQTNPLALEGFETGSHMETTTETLQSVGLRCEMCDVRVTSHQQMTLHLNGQKHKKRLQMQSGLKIPAEGIPVDNILSTLSSNVPSGDLSVYRTPTGDYYCNPCNLTVNSEMQFKQHLVSKKHRKSTTNSTGN